MIGWQLLSSYHINVKESYRKCSSSYFLTNVLLQWFGGIVCDDIWPIKPCFCYSQKLSFWKPNLPAVMLHKKSSWGWAYSPTFSSVHTHTHTQPFNGPFPGLPRWSGTRKVKPIWILLEQETVSGSGISWAVCKSAPRSRQITTPAPQHSVLLQTRCPSCCPTNSVKALKVLLIALRTYSHFVLANNAVHQPRLLFFVEQESSLFSMLSRFADQTCKTVSLLFLWLIDMVSSLAQEWCHLAAFWLALKANLFNIAFSF